MDWLSHALDSLFPPRADEVQVREASEDALAKLCNPRTVQLAGEDVIVLLPYRHALVKACIREAKYKGNAKACRMLGFALADYLGEKAADNVAFSQGLALLPLPLSNERLKERGHNQAERIVACALSRLGLRDAPSTIVLTRVRDTASQATLPRRERLNNIKGAFRAENIDPILDYVIVDDVITTGATLTEAAKAVRTAGAKNVSAIALAH